MVQEFGSRRTFQLMLVLVCFITASLDADARSRRKRVSGKRTNWASHGSKCSDKTKASPTMYFLPKEGKVRNFQSEVRMQGSGILRDGRILTYTGKILPAPTNCTTTKTSASGQCLLSYFSIAADVSSGSGNRMGDIIEMPQLKGTKVTLPDSGKVIEHPGFFIIHDVGGAIKGSNRFDFFTGLDNPYTKNTDFRKIGMGDKYKCNKSFRRLARGGSEYEAAKKLIYSLTDSTDVSGGVRRIASIPEGHK